VISIDFLRGQRVGVLGLRRTGQAALDVLLNSGCDVRVWDDDVETLGWVIEERPQVGLLDRPDCFEGMQRLVVSPGVPHLYPVPHPIIAQAVRAGVPLDNDIGLLFAWREGTPSSRRPGIVAVTGSNGKSTTVELIAHILRRADIDAIAVGNVGRPVLAEATEGRLLVLEVSSYQTELARLLRPDIAVFLNLSDDHLGRHGGRGGYFAAKARLFLSGMAGTVVIGLEEPEVSFYWIEFVV